MRILGKLLVLFCFFVLTMAKAAEPVAPDGAVAGKAKIVIVRSNSMASAANLAHVWLNEVSAGSVAAGEFLSGEADAGKVKIRVKPGGLDIAQVSKHMELDASPGETYYVFIDMSFFSGYKLSILEKEEALKLIEKYKVVMQQRKDDAAKRSER